MKTSHPGHAVRGGLCAVLMALTLTAPGARAADTGPSTAAWSPHTVPILRIQDGAVRGAAVSGGLRSSSGLPYAAPPTGNLRWRPPQPPAWLAGRPGRHAVRAELPAAAEPVRCRPAPFSEDCLYLNVYTPTLAPQR